MAIRLATLVRSAVLATALGLILGAAPASAAPIYTMQTSTGASIVPGTTDIGNHGDDTVTVISFPFPVTIYDQKYTSAGASSNGNLQMTTTDTSFTNSCLPASKLGVSIMPYWDDFTLVNSGFAIFTSVTGFAPRRIFNIEWQTQYFPATGSATFEVQLHEDSPIITIIYGANTATGDSATAGVQAGAGSFTQFSCNTGGKITSGLRIDYVPNGRTLHVLKGGLGTGTITSADPGINCGATCEAAFADGTNEVLTATPDTGSTFSGWSGGGCSGTGPCAVTLGSDQSVKAAFDVVPPLAPDTKIDRAKVNQDTASATFKFEALPATAPATSGFQCALVKKKRATPTFKGCKSPKTYKHLKPHRYLFEVRAFGPAGSDATPAKKRFRIK